MADIPINKTRRYNNYKFYYTRDDGTTIITSCHINKKPDGSYILAPTAMLEARKVTDPSLKKAKFWGKPENLRKIEITYAEPNNVSGRAETRRYCPYAPTADVLAYIEEVRLQGKNDLPEPCFAYRSENRFTNDRPQRINAIANPNQSEATI